MNCKKVTISRFIANIYVACVGLLDLLNSLAVLCGLLSALYVSIK